jgi:hypothetical protein
MVEDLSQLIAGLYADCSNCELHAKWMFLFAVAQFPFETCRLISDVRVNKLVPTVMYFSCWKLVSCPLCSVIRCLRARRTSFSANGKRTKKEEEKKGNHLSHHIARMIIKFYNDVVGRADGAGLDVSCEARSFVIRYFLAFLSRRF